MLRALPVTWRGRKSIDSFRCCADLVPREVAEAWLTYLREELPTVAFKCSTQKQVRLHCHPPMACHPFCSPLRAIPSCCMLLLCQPGAGKRKASSPQHAFVGGKLQLL